MVHQSLTFVAITFSYVEQHMWLYIQVQTEREMPHSPPLLIFNSHSYVLSGIQHISRYCNIALLSLYSSTFSLFAIITFRGCK